MVVTATDLAAAAAAEVVDAAPGFERELGRGMNSTFEAVEKEEAEDMNDVTNVDPLSLGSRNDTELNSDVAVALVHDHDDSDVLGWSASDGSGLSRR